MAGRWCGPRRGSTSYLFPATLLLPDPSTEDETGLRRMVGEFGLMITTGDAEDADLLHQLLLDEAQGDPEPYHAGEDNWLATAVDLEDGTHVMARSERARRGFETLVVLASDRYVPQMQLLMASYRRGSQAPLAVPPGGVGGVGGCRARG